MKNEDQQAPRPGSQGGLVSIEKAILLDVCLGIPLGKIWLRLPASEVGERFSEGPDTTLFRGQQLELLKRLHHRGDSEIAEAMAELTRMADASLDKGPFSVTRKTGLPATEDPHDYYSLAKYWWPSDNTEDRLPYVKRDGDVNPDCYSDRYDFTELEAFAETVLLLALAAYLTDRADYGKQASRLLATWFVDAETRQNPTFECAQAVPGKHAGRWQGIVEARRFIYVVEAVHLLESAGLLPAELSRALRSWFGEFLDWLTENARGKEAGASKNNIGFWYDLQRMVYADFCGRAGLASDIAMQITIPRLDQQLAEDGSLPAEKGRAYPYDYVAFTLVAMAMISAVGKKHGLELWDPRDSDGRNFRVAHDWLLKTTRSHELIDHLRSVRTTGLNGGKAVAEPGEETGQFALPPSPSTMVDIGLQLRGVWRVASLRERGLLAEREKVAGLHAELQQTQSKHAAERTSLGQVYEARARDLEAKLKQEKSHSDSLREQLSERSAHAEGLEATIEKQGETQKSEKAFLEAQIETGNAMWAHFRGRAEAAERTLQGLRQKLNEAEKLGHSVEKKLENLRKERDAERKSNSENLKKAQKRFEKERRYLQAQIDTANTMWSYYQREGRNRSERPPLEDNSRTKRVAAKAGAHKTARPEPERAGDSLAAERKHLQQDIRVLTRYSLKLRERYLLLLSSRGWRAMAPARVLTRFAKRISTGRVVVRNRLPPAPKHLEEVAQGHWQPDAGGDPKTQVQALRKKVREVARYAAQLERKIDLVLHSRTWRAMAPVREVGRRVKGILIRKQSGPFRLPERPGCVDHYL